MTNLSEKVTGIKLEKVCTIKADKDSKESKAVTLKVDFDGVTLQDVFTKALAGVVIQWQNGPGRKNFTKWQDKQVVEVSFKAPASAPAMSLMDKLKAEAVADGVDPEDKKALTEYIKAVIAKM